GEDGPRRSGPAAGVLMIETFSRGSNPGSGADKRRQEGRGRGGLRSRGFDGLAVGFEGNARGFVLQEAVERRQVGERIAGQLAKNAAKRLHPGPAGEPPERFGPTFVLRPALHSGQRGSRRV